MEGGREGGRERGILDKAQKGQDGEGVECQDKHFVGV